VRAIFFSQRTQEIFDEHILALLGVPLSCLLAFGLVLVLEQYAGNIKFKMFGIEFSGAAGPAVFWILFFLAQVLALKVLWVTG